MMPKAAKKTAYYLNGKIAALALINKGVRFPSGTWIQVADPNVPPRHVEEMLAAMLPALMGRVISFANLTNESDVVKFERSLPESL